MIYRISDKTSRLGRLAYRCDRNSEVMLWFSFLNVGMDTKAT